MKTDSIRPKGFREGGILPRTLGVVPASKARGRSSIEEGVGECPHTVLCLERLPDSDELFELNFCLFVCCCLFVCLFVFPLLVHRCSSSCDVRRAAERCSEQGLWTDRRRKRRWTEFVSRVLIWGCCLLVIFHWGSLFSSCETRKNIGNTAVMNFSSSSSSSSASSLPVSTPFPPPHDLSDEWTVLFRHSLSCC